MTVRDIRSGFDDFRNWATDPRPRIGIGLPFFDQATNGGLAKAECAMVMAYSSVGKTWIALNTIVNNPDVPTLFFSIEMSWRQVVARLSAIYAGTPTWELESLLKAGSIPVQINETSNRFPLLLGNDQSEMSIKQMKEEVLAAGHKLGQPIRLVVIDYLELIGGAGLLGKSEAVDRAAQKIRALAKDCDTAVIVLHQVGKGDGSDGHKPLAIDSGKYGGHQPMDYVIGAYAPRLDRDLSEVQQRDLQDELYLQLLKNRNGRANSTGVRHRLDSTTGAITPWGSFRQYQSGGSFQAELMAGYGRPAPDLSGVAS